MTVVIPMDGPTPMDTPKPKCRAHNRAGNPCGRYPIPGGTVCVMHGGASPRTAQKAKMRLLELIDPAIGVLAAEMEKADSSADRQRAANSILDRAGMNRGAGTDGDVLRAMILDRLVELSVGNDG